MKKIINEIKDYFDEFELIWTQINKVDTVQVTNSREKNRINLFSEKWFSDYESKMVSLGIEKDVVEKYNNVYRELLKLSSANSRRKSYIKQLEIIRMGYKEDIIIFLQTHSSINNVEDGNQLSKEILELIDKIEDEDENEYLREALGCWKNCFYKAAVVLMWCATIDRIHKVIEHIGFDVFNSTSEYMKNQTVGRYKKFNKNQNVHSISELRMVFDSDILSIIEGMGLIDINQKTRLVSCFDMRCHSGHPGEAPITKYNVLSCFSDIVEIVFTNQKFSLTNIDEL